MEYAEMLGKTQIAIVGICKGVNEYVSKKSVPPKIYFSVDVEVAPSKNPVNIKLPDNFDRLKLKLYDLCQIKCEIKPSYDKRSIEIHALR
jgi:hypothetical protein